MKQITKKEGKIITSEKGNRRDTKNTKNGEEREENTTEGNCGITLTERGGRIMT